MLPLPSVVTDALPPLTRHEPLELLEADRIGPLSPELKFPASIFGLKPHSPYQRLPNSICVTTALLNDFIKRTYPSNSIVLIDEEAIAIMTPLIGLTGELR
jgi:hypothetical protein